MKDFFSAIISIFFKIFSNITLIYKNFIHWNISKILIWFGAFVTAFLYSLIPLLLWGVFLFSSNLDVFNLEANISQLLNPIGWNFLAFDVFWIVGLLFLISGILILYIGMSYSRVLIARLYYSYLDRSRLLYKKNKYFSRAYFTEYMKIIGSMFWVCLIYTVVTVIILWLLFGGSYLVWWNNFVQSLWEEINFFAISSFVIVGIYVIACIYSIYRLSFAHFFLAEKKQSYRQALKRSFRATKSFTILAQFVVICIAFVIVLSPFSYISDTLDMRWEKIDIYWKFVQQVRWWKPEEILSSEDFYRYSLLQGEFSWYSWDQLTWKYKNIRILQIIYYIVHFLLIYWIFEMILVTFYRERIANK